MFQPRWCELKQVSASVHADEKESHLARTHALDRRVERGLPTPVLDAPVPATLNDIIGRDPGAAAGGWTPGYFGAM
jgi:hypothetical protein